MAPGRPRLGREVDLGFFPSWPKAEFWDLVSTKKPSTVQAVWALQEAGQPDPSTEASRRILKGDFHTCAGETLPGPLLGCQQLVVRSWWAEAGLKGALGQRSFQSPQPLLPFPPQPLLSQSGEQWQGWGAEARLPAPGSPAP